MRIACLHVPQFALQCLTRIDPSLRGAPVAVVSVGSSASQLATSGVRAALYAPVVQACSRAAWALGIRLGMTATAANAAAPGELRVVGADAALERETVRALADGLLGVSTVVDVGGRVGAGGAHLAVYCEVPSKTRGTSYGDRLLEVVEALGLTGRIGIADDRFTAWVAAAHGGLPSNEHGEQGVVSVPRGGSAAFLAPMPLSLLAITPEVQHMLEALGVRTLGEFASLPAPSVTRPLEADYQALARGDSGSGLRPYTPEAPVREEAVITAVQGGAAAVAMLADRIALRLRGRGRGAARIEVTVSGEHGEHVIPITAAVALGSSIAGMTERSGLQVLESAEVVAEALGKALGDELSTAWRFKAAVTAEALAGQAELELEHAPASPPIDVLGVVLRTTGALDSWQLTSPTGPSTLRSERRDAHRRTRHGKQDRRGRSRLELVQPRLFADRK